MWEKRSCNHGRRLDDHFYFRRDVCGLCFAWIHPAVVPILRGKCLLCAPLLTESRARKASLMPRIAFLTQTFSLLFRCVFWVQCDMAELWRIVSERADHYLFDRTPIRWIIDYLTMTDCFQTVLRLFNQNMPLVCLCFPPVDCDNIVCLLSLLLSESVWTDQLKVCVHPQKSLQFVCILGAGLLCGTALAIIIPEGVDLLEESLRGEDTQS